MKREEPQPLDHARIFPADMSLFEMLARMTPAERLRLHDRAVNAALKLREAARRQVRR